MNVEELEFAKCIFKRQVLVRKQRKLHIGQRAIDEEPKCHERWKTIDSLSENISSPSQQSIPITKEKQ